MKDVVSFTSSLTTLPFYPANSLSESGATIRGYAFNSARAQGKIAITLFPIASALKRKA
jgi:hypothetical protein